MVIQDYLQRAVIEEDWRSYGRAKRHELLEEDKTHQHHQLEVKPSTDIQKYLDVANKVSSMISILSLGGVVRKRETTNLTVYPV